MLFRSVLGGFGVSYARIKRYDGRTVDATDDTGHTVDGLEATTRLGEDCAANRVVGCPGGRDNFLRFGLSYDTQWGASAYTEYDWNTYDNAHFDLTAFLARSRGSVVNCTDCASILEAHANMLGAVLSYTIITPSFDLNYILAIGGDEYTHCPFGGSSCGFSYHAVTTPDDGNTIYDATLALDGDDDPGSAPNEVLMVEAIDGDEYLDRLVKRGRPDYVYTQKETLQ